MAGPGPATYLGRVFDLAASPDISAAAERVDGAPTGRGRTGYKGGTWDWWISREGNSSAIPWLASKSKSACLGFYFSKYF